MANKNEIVKVTTGKNPQGVMLIDGAKIYMPADTGRETNKIYAAVEVGNKANLTLCEAIARIKTTESYKEVLDADGEYFTPTFGEFAEKVLNMSKSGASGYASVGEIFAGMLDNGYKYGHFVLMLKLRKILDENNEPLTGAAIIEMLEDHGANTEMSTRELDNLIKSLLNDTIDEGTDEGAEGEGEGGEGTGEDEGDEDNRDDLTKAFDVIREKATSAGLYETLSAAIADLEKRLKGV